jgi:PAS domain S-box-containing protein
METKTIENPKDLQVWEHAFCQLAEAIGAVFRLTHAEDGRTLYISQGCSEIWGQNCETTCNSTRAWFDAIHPKDSDRMFDASLRIGKKGGYDEEYRVVRPDGSVRWVRERAFGIRNEAGEMLSVASITEDVTDRKALEKEVVETNDRERSKLGRDLHDGICQQLVSIAFATDLLRRDLAGKSPGEAVRAAKITSLLDNAISQARNLSHALCPVNLAGDGLAVALRSLAGSVNHGSGVVCGADCSEQVFIHDHAVATHLYRIAQEAVLNTIKHSGPTQVLIKLDQEGNTIRLSVGDNGACVDEDTLREFNAGLNVIKFRANIAGARLKVEKNASGGTLVECAVQQDASEERRTPEDDVQLLGAKA